MFSQPSCARLDQRSPPKRARVTSTTYNADAQRRPLLGIIFGDAFSEKELSQGVEKMTKSPFDTLMEVSTGFVLPRTLHVIAELGIADALEETPRSTEALAAATGTNAEALNRALRVLSAHGIFAGQGGVYAHTPSSLLLRSDHPQSMRSFV